MPSIARTPYARDAALWVAGGDSAAFASALAAHENESWTGGYTGGVDESLATFDHEEYWIARRLAMQGHNVIALPTRHLAGLRSPDAAVSGLLTEFKTYTGVNPRQLLSRVGHALPQADRVVVSAEGKWDPALVRSVFQVAVKSALRRGMQAVMFIGDDFQFEWGDWNGLLTDSAAPTPRGGSAPRSVPVTRAPQGVRMLDVGTGEHQRGGRYCAVRGEQEVPLVGRGHRAGRRS